MITLTPAPAAPGWPEDILPAASLDAAAAEISGWADYVPTPLRRLPGLARRLGLALVLAKDEGARFGRGGVKALGAPYGLATLLRAHGAEPGSPACAAFTAVAATDGNHGLALAWAAQRFGCACRIYVAEAVDQARVAAIAACGATVVTVPGTYDAAVLAAEAAAAESNALLVTDTDYDGDRAVTRAIMSGYAVAGREAWAQMAPHERPTHVFLQCGVGGMAAGVAAGLWQAGGMAPTVVTVEPEAAACVQAGLRSGGSVQIAGDLHTRMVGLSCGRASVPALAVLRRIVRASLTVPEETAAALQQSLADDAFGDGALACGDTGVAGLAGLWAAANDPATRAALGLGPDSRVLTVVSERPLPTG